MKCRMRIFKKLIYLLLVVSIIASYGCIESDSDYKTPEQITAELSNNLITLISNKDAEGIKTLLCPRFKDTHKNLDEEIQGIFKFIDGDIVSYDEPMGAGCGGSTTPEEGWVEKLAMPTIYNIRTTSGEVYNITYVYYFINKVEPDLLGIESINVLLEDDGSEETRGSTYIDKYQIAVEES